MLDNFPPNVDPVDYFNNLTEEQKQALESEPSLYEFKLNHFKLP